jgi:multiple sugar transport system permease protein/raffinose/stachyose/melibiose transport system permease protein
LFSLILFTIWADIGYNTVLFTAGIDGIPKEFYEAADIDGAGPILRFFKITLPLLGRTFSFVAAMTLISHFQMFAQFRIFASTGGAGNAGRVLTSYIYHIGFTAKDMGYSAAISVTLFIIILVFTAVQQRLNKVDWGY